MIAKTQTHFPSRFPIQQRNLSQKKVEKLFTKAMGSLLQAIVKVTRTSSVNGFLTQVAEVSALKEVVVIAWEQLSKLQRPFLLQVLGLCQSSKFQWLPQNRNQSHSLQQEPDWSLM